MNNKDIRELNKDLSNCIRKLDSNKITERKIFREELKHLLERDNIVEFLNNNCELNDQHYDIPEENLVTWKSLLLSCHKCFIMEVEKELKKQVKVNSFKVQQPILDSCSCLLKIVINKANQTKPCLQIVDLLNCIMDVSKNNIYQMYAGEVYYKILEQNVLSRKYYWPILGEYWNDIFKLACNIYVENFQSISLKIMKQIINRGHNQSCVTLSIKKRLFSYLKKAIKDSIETNKDYTFKEDIINLVYTAYKMIGVECRMSLCEFSEENGITLIHFYKNNGLKKVQKYMYKLLIKFIEIHHPKLVGFEHKASCIVNKNIWSQVLFEIYQFAHQEIQITKNNPIENCLYYLEQLAVVAFNVVYMCIKSDSMNFTPNNFSTSKKQKLDISLLNFVDNINPLRSIENKYFWTSIVTQILKSNSTTVPLSDNEYIYLIEKISKMFNVCKDKNVVKCLLECCKVLIEIEKKSCFNFFDSYRAKCFYKDVWNYTLKNITSNDNLETSHNLLQSLILSNYWQNELYVEIIRLYVNKIVEPNDFSLRTLIVLFKEKDYLGHTNNESYMDVLFEWMLPLKIHPASTSALSKVDPKLLAVIIVFMITNIWIDKFLFTEICLDNISTNNINNIYFYLKLQDIPRIMPKSSVELESKNEKPIFNDKISLQLENYFTQIILLKDEPNINVLNTLFENINLVCFVENQLLKLDISSTQFKPIRLKFLDKISDILSKIINNFNDNDKEEFIKICSQYYERLSVIKNELLYEIIQHKSNKQIMQKLNNLSDYKVPLLDTIKVLEYNSLTKHQVLCIKANQVMLKLCLFEYCKTNDRKKILLEELLNHFENMENHIFSQPYNFYKVSNFIHGVYSINNLTEGTLIRVNKLLKQLAKHWCSHKDGFIKIVVLLQDAVFRTNQFKENVACTSNLLLLIKSLQKVTFGKKCGPTMICTFVDFLGNFAISSYGCFGTQWSTVNVECFSPESLLNYLRSPFVEVRIAVVKYLYIICDVYEKNPNAYSISYKEMINIVLNNIHEGFTVNSDISEEEQEDERLNRTSTYMLCMQALILTSNTFRKECLFELLYTVNKKNLDINLLYNLLDGITTEFNLNSYITLLEDYLSYLLWKWNSTFTSLNEFPFKIFACNTLEIFYYKYISKVLPIFIVSNNIDSIKKFKNINQILKEYFAQIYTSLMIVKSKSDSSNCTETESFIENVLGQVTFNDLIKSSFTNILLQCTQMIDIEEHTDYPIEINRKQFLKIINIFQENLIKSKVSLLIIMSKKQPNSIQNIVHTLYVNIFKRTTIDLKCQVFFQYTIFMKILIDELINDIRLNDFTFFLVNQSVHAVVILLNQKNSEIKYHAFEYLEWLLINLKNNLFLNKNLSHLYKLILNVVKHSLKEPSPIDKFAHKILSALQEFYNISSSLINTKTLNKSSLDKLIMDFLSEQTEIDDPIQSLKQLKYKLKTSEDQLQIIYKEFLTKRGFSEDCAKSVLHRLIVLLIRLSWLKDHEVKILSASCLGILGPLDLKTLILQPEPEIIKLTLDISPEYSFLKHTVELLLNYISDSNVSVMEASNKAMFEIMSSQIGTSLNKDFDSSSVYPYKFNQFKGQALTCLNFTEFKEKVDRNDLWCPKITISTSYEVWITCLTKTLLSTLQGYCQSLLLIAEHKPLFCEQIIPHLIFFILKDNSNTQDIFVNQINNFFLKHSEMIKMTVDGLKNSVNENCYDNNIYRNRSAVQCLLNIINFVRLQQKGPIQHLLPVDYLYIAQAAQFCSAFFTSIMYLEFWCEMEFRKNNIDRWTMSFNPVDVISEILPKDISLLLQYILNKAYKNIGDFDAIEGCGSSHLLTVPSRSNYYQILGKWDHVMENCDLQLNKNTVDKDYLNALAYSGLPNIAHILSIHSDNPNYDYCWQLGKWDLPYKGEKSFEALHYHAMRCIHQKNHQGTILFLNEARLAVLESFSCTSLESTAIVYTPLTKLKMLEDLEDFITIVDKNALLKNWLDQTSIKTNDFVNYNLILTQRSILLDLNAEETAGILRLNIAELAREDNKLQKAGNICTIVSLRNYNNHTTLWAKLEEARLLWQRKDRHIARVLLKHVVEELDNYEYTYLNSLALQLYGSWIEETKSENAHCIIKNYFQKAIKLLDVESISAKEPGLDYRKVLLDAHKRLSKYTDTLYQQASKYLKEEDLQKRLSEVKNVKEKGHALITMGKFTNDIDRCKAGSLLMNQSRVDESEISNTNSERINHLKLALQNYLRLIELESESELPIYRILSLWLENKDNLEINSIVDEGFEKSPSYMFISVLPQLVAHLSSSEDNNYFNLSLKKLLDRCAKEHPHHTLPIVYAVANSCIDRKINGEEIDKNEPRINTAKLLMTKWRKDKKIGNFVVTLEKLYEALIKLAYTKFNNASQNEKHQIPDEELLMKMKNIDCLCPAYTLPLNKNGQYSNIISVVNFKNHFINAGGLHQPKKIECMCSDGESRPLLLKANEDMRQDAVMQQVFLLMNRLFKLNKSTSQRKLTIRTYKVVPFSQQSGIAEWCTNTMSLGDYLIGRNTKPGAHQLYRPNDLPPGDARSIIKMSKDNKDSNFAREKKYLEVCKKLKPVFRYFFFEKFVSPSIWFERRQAYIHSVATSSMVGYILGIGDRHVQNILIDNETAELIHIDFGIAFDQGTLLTTPETVPFRLSRDIEDGMGICGIEGTFRKCCEKTIEVLRQNQDVIVTVIEVLLYDPCYHWTLTTEKAAKLQDDSIISYLKPLVEINKSAERSLNKVRTKLLGMEDTGSKSSISGQVNRLIQEARDYKNLSLLFHGWQAYL
ncbi:serine-protein kinase ATM isoform X2 [Daktulosphaira vitifoliae]|uniref:serine-protein kinase ATM isoform X2 n=1 Tax=Daktulosphaira vitifoliae TaxID=58002 RepID=UPI0021AA603D|nr:serine-protein kinase ATM isoform X2 [Daktulosphaira vitifoliae]